MLAERRANQAAHMRKIKKPDKAERQMVMVPSEKTAPIRPAAGPQASPAPSNGSAGALAPLRLDRGAYSHSDANVVVILRDPEHQLLGPFVARPLGQDARFFRSLVPLFGAVELLRCNGHGTHHVAITT